MSKRLHSFLKIPGKLHRNSPCERSVGIAMKKEGISSNPAVLGKVSVNTKVGKGTGEQCIGNGKIKCKLETGTKQKVRWENILQVPGKIGIMNSFFCGRKIYQTSLCFCLGQTLFINLLVNVLSLSIDFRLKKTELLLFPFVFHLYDVQSATVIFLKAVNGRKWRKTIHCGKTYVLLLCCFKHSI